MAWGHGCEAYFDDVLLVICYTKIVFIFHFAFRLIIFITSSHTNMLTHLAPALHSDQVPWCSLCESVCVCVSVLNHPAYIHLCAVRPPKAGR